MRKLNPEDVEGFFGEEICDECGDVHREDMSYYELCAYCGDVEGRYEPNDCMNCFQIWADRRWVKYLDAMRDGRA